MRRLGVAMLLSAVIVVGVGIASARVTHPSAISFSSSGAGLSSIEAFGSVTSTRAVCIPNRTVKIFAQTASGQELVDTDKTSGNGFFGGGGQTSGEPSGIRATVVRKRIGPDRFCGARSTFVKVVLP